MALWHHYDIGRKPGLERLAGQRSWREEAVSEIIRADVSSYSPAGDALCMWVC